MNKYCTINHGIITNQEPFFRLEWLRTKIKSSSTIKKSLRMFPIGSIQSRLGAKMLSLHILKYFKLFISYKVRSEYRLTRVLLLGFQLHFLDVNSKFSNSKYLWAVACSKLRYCNKYLHETIPSKPFQQPF